jgi:hypothetical protein
VTHPFHPWCGREFLLVDLRQTWGEDRVFFVDEDGQLFSLPLGWTDAAPVVPFVEMAAGRSPFRAEDLVALAELVAGSRGSGPASNCKPNSAGRVREILPSGRVRPRVYRR